MESSKAEVGEAEEAEGGEEVVEGVRAVGGRVMDVEGERAVGEVKEKEVGRV